MPTSSATPATNGLRCAATPTASSPPPPWTSWPPASEQITRHPRSRASSAGPGTAAGYLTAPGEDEDQDDAPDEDEDDGRGGGEDGERLELLIRLREAFPPWAISYWPFSRTWTACKDGATICENSPALLCLALALIERTQRRARHGPGGDRPPWGDQPPS